MVNVHFMNNKIVSGMRKIGMGRGTVTAYPRQLESLIRLAEAHARMRLSNLVEELDVEEATRLHKEALKQAATDPKTGRFETCHSVDRQDFNKYFASSFWICRS